MTKLQHLEDKLIYANVEVKNFLQELFDALWLVQEDLRMRTESIYGDAEGYDPDDIQCIDANALIIESLCRRIEFEDVPNLKELYEEVKKEIKKGTKQNDEQGNT